MTNPFEIIKKETEKRNLTGNDVAKGCGFSSGLWSQWNKGLQKPSAEKIIQIADYLEVSVDYLLGRSESPIIVSSWDDLYKSIDKMSDAQLDSLVRKIQDSLSKRQGRE